MLGISRIRYSLLLGVAVIFAAELINVVTPFMDQKAYALGNSEGLLSPVNQQMADKLTYDTKQRVFNFSNGQDLSPQAGSQSGATAISATAHEDPRKGLVVTDAIKKVDLTMTPQFSLMSGKKDGNRIVYPLQTGNGWAIYTMTGTGVKEDIVLSSSASDSASFEYKLSLGDSLRAKLEVDGSIGVYGNALFSSNISTGTEKDAETLKNARKNAAKDTFLFQIPKPTIIERDTQTTNVKASYKLDGEALTVNVEGLAKAHYPLSIDPSIYVVTAQQFMAGNNETNVDFDVTNKLIKKGRTTGARFDNWTTATSLPAGYWGAGTAAAGGYLYSVGGASFSGQAFTSQGSGSFVVPTGVTSVTFRAWGGGGGGGSGGSTSTGGAGGGGGYTTGTIATTPGETLNVYVGGGGSAGTKGTSSGGGGGGGYSSIYRSSTALAIAAGGGGGGGGRNAASNNGGAGGGGGGTSGVAGTNVGGGTGGGGGTSSAGGTGGTGACTGTSGGAGTSLTGGRGLIRVFFTCSAGGGASGGLATGGAGGSFDSTFNNSGGGGGGSGYFGGGGGSEGTNSGASGGGGGSSYIDAGVSSSSTSAGSGTTPGNSGDSYRNGAADGGAGGASNGTGTVGDNGIIVITYGSGGFASSQTVNWSQLNTSTGGVDSPNPGTGACQGWCTTSAYNLPAARSNVSLVAYNGFLYAFGGTDSNCTTGNSNGNSGICKTVYIAKLGANGEPRLWHPTDANTNNWVYWYQDTNLSSERAYSAAVAYNNRMYLLGGKTASGAVTTAEIAEVKPNGTLGTWTSTNSIPSANAVGSSAVAYNDRIYVIGGASAATSATATNTYAYNKINSDGTLNSWVTSGNTTFTTGRMAMGGSIAVVQGAYIYVSAGCGAINSSGYCTSTLGDTQLASINADGSLDTWNTIGGVSDSRIGFGMVAWRDRIYEVGGCTAQNTSTGDCNGFTTSSIIYSNNSAGTGINQDGDASSISLSVASGTGACNGGSPTDCNLPGVASVGNILNQSIIVNGYLYVMGGCTNVGCSSTSSNVAYVAIGSNGHISKPATCPSGSYQGTAWCVDNVHTLGGLAAGSPVSFGGRIYIVGGFRGSGNSNTIYYTTYNTDGSINAWTSQTMSSVATSVSYTFAYARANPSAASSVPGNLYIFGGCTTSSGAACSAYTANVYKCDIQTSGAIANCSTSNQLQIGTLAGADGPGLATHSGVVYANYIYLVGGIAPNNVSDLDTARYAKFDDNNNVVAVSGSAWIVSPTVLNTARRRSAAFGYNGYLYVVGGYDTTSGVLPDIEFAKINVSDGSLVGDSNNSNKFYTSQTQINQRWGVTVPVSNSFAYVIGGCTTGVAPSNCSAASNVVQTFQLYNNDSGAPAGYTTSANTYGTNANRIGVASTILNGYIYAAGGCTGTTDCTSAVDTVSYAAIDAYGNLGSWSNTTNPLPAARAWGKLLNAGGSLYYVGGQDTSGASQSTVYYATPSSGNVSSWSTASNGLPNARSQFGAAVWNNRLYVVGGGDSVASGKSTYTSAGSSTFVVPAGVTSITVKAWGGGGAGGNGVTFGNAGGAGGGGGFVQAAVSVTPGESLTVLVGNGGTRNTASGNGGNGGGYSAIQRSSTFLVQAGGGGAGGGSSGGAGGAGGAGGGGNGTASTIASGAGGGTSSAGGTAGGAGNGGAAGNSGAANQGGDAGGSAAACNTAISTRGGNGGTGAGGKGGTLASCYGGGGGGGGRFGGGGGGSDTFYGGGGGGGGSSLTPNNCSGSDICTNASGTTPGQSGDADRGTAGNGGTGSTSTASTAGNPGTVVISYGGLTPSTSVYVSPQLNSGGNITSAWSTSSSSFNVARSGAAVAAYANNLYLFGGNDGSNYLSDTQFAKIDTSTGNVGTWSYSESMPTPLAGGDSFAANGYVYIIGGRSATTTCNPITLVAPVSANTPIASGNNPTGLGLWYAANQRYTGARYGNAAVYNDGKAYVLGGACGSPLTYASPVTQQTTILSQPQVAKYSIMFDTDSDVFPSHWLLNGLDNSIGARWQLKYRSMTDPSATGPNGTGKNCSAAAMSTWGQETSFGDVTLMQPGIYTPRDGSNTNTNCARYYYFNVSVDSSKTFGYPDDVTRGPTITDLTLRFTSQPSKRLMHGRTFTGGLQMPNDTPYYSN